MRQCRDYVNIRSFGVVFISLTTVFRAFFIGITHTRVITVITICMALVNVVFNYLFVFGEYGFPQLGIKGSALASVIAEFTAIAGYSLYAFYANYTRKFRLFRFPKPDIGVAKNILSVGFPLMLQSWIAISSWFVFFLFIEKMGERALAVSSIVKSIYIVLMIPIWGFGSATNTLVSNAMGAQRQHEVKLVLKKVLLLSVCSTSFFMLINLFFPQLILSIYSNDPGVIKETIGPLRVISAALVIFAAGAVLFQAVSGTGATKIALRIELVTLCLYMLYIVLVAGLYALPLIYIWASEFIYTGSLLLGSLIYLRSGKWKSIKI